MKKILEIMRKNEFLDFGTLRRFDGPKLQKVEGGKPWYELVSGRIVKDTRSWGLLVWAFVFEHEDVCKYVIG